MRKNSAFQDEYQALQLALTTAETKLNSVKRENDTLITQLMALKVALITHCYFCELRIWIRTFLAAFFRIRKNAIRDPEQGSENPNKITLFYRNILRKCNIFRRILSFVVGNE